MKPVPVRISKAFGAGLIALALAAAVVVLSDRVFWDRYLRAYQFDTFVENPFPSIDRLYPQEVVNGVEPQREIPRRLPARRYISSEALELAAEFAEKSQSTSLIVYLNGEIEFEQYWLGAGPERPIYSFSMHKSVVALLIGIAIREGHIESVDEPLSRYLPEWADDERAAITIRHALHMNSGLEPMSFPTNPFSKHVQRQIGTSLGDTALSFSLRNPPGTVFDYNGVNPTLLVMVIERATGRRYADYLSENIWEPLGNREAAVWLDQEGGLARGATSLYAVPMDWLRIGELVLNQGVLNGEQIVTSDWIQQMTSPSPTNPLYGFLIWVGSEYVETRELESFEGFAATADDPFVAGDVVYFDGLGGQRVYVIPSRDMVIVRTGVLSQEWQDSILPNVLVAGLEPSEPEQLDSETTQ